MSMEETAALLGLGRALKRAGVLQGDDKQRAHKIKNMSRRELNKLAGSLIGAGDQFLAAAKDAGTLTDCVACKLPREDVAGGRCWECRGLTCAGGSPA